MVLPPIKEMIGGRRRGPIGEIPSGHCGKSHRVTADTVNLDPVERVLNALIAAVTLVHDFDIVQPPD